MDKTPCWLLAAFLVMPLPALARPDAADPVAPAPAIRYSSAFADYKAWRDLKPGDWRAMNDALGTAAADHGSHGSQGAAAAAAVQAAVPARASSGPQAPASGHGGHGMHPMPGGQP